MTDRAGPLLTRLARRPALWLLVLAAALWLPGALTLPPLDRDESRFAQASKQMLETHDFVDIRFSTGTRYNKPVGIYWLQAASTELLGRGARNRIWTYRIPSLVGGYFALLLIFACARAFLSREEAFAAALLLGTSVLMTAETQIATTDAVLLAGVLGAQAVLFRLYLAARDAGRAAPSQGLVLAGWFAFALGVLVKGPVVAGVLGATAAAVSLWDREWRWLKTVRPLKGLLVIAVVALPWFVAIAIQSHGAFFRQSLGHDFGDKLVGGQESHGAPPGYFLVLATLTLWPAVLFVLPALFAGWTRRGEPAMRYLLAWAGASWAMFEVVPTKLPHYILPAYPALMLLAAAWLLAPQAGPRPRTMAALRGVSALQFAIGLAAFGVVAALAPVRFGGGIVWPLVSAAGIGALAGLWAVVSFLRDARATALAATVLAALILVPLLTVGVAPRLDTLWVSPRAAALAAKDHRAGDPPPVIAGYVEPSLIFLLGTDTHVSTGAGAAVLTAHQGGLALVEDRERSAFLAGLGALDTEAYPVDQLSGFDYSHGRKVHITLYRVVPLAAAD